MSINFFSESIDFQLERESIFKKWLSRVISDEGKQLGEINFTFVSEDRILEINKVYLKHQYFTDIITFDSGFMGLINGDIFISVDTVRTNAEEHDDGNFSRELARNLVHGVLHLLGYKDHSDSEKLLMRTKEDFYLAYMDEYSIG